MPKSKDKQLMTPTSNSIPFGYRLLDKLDRPTKKMATRQEICNLLLLPLFLVLFGLIADVTRQDYSSLEVLRAFDVAALSRQLLTIGWAVGILAIGTCLHEAIHGCFVWIFSVKRTRFGIRSVRPYTALHPDAHVSRNQGLVIAVAPLAAITVVGSAILPFVPFALVTALVLTIAANAPGSIEDFRVLVWLIRHHRYMRWGFDGSSNLAYEPAEYA